MVAAFVTTTTATVQYQWLRECRMRKSYQEFRNAFHEFLHYYNSSSTQYNKICGLLCAKPCIPCTCSAWCCWVVGTQQMDLGTPCNNHPQEFNNYILTWIKSKPRGISDLLSDDSVAITSLGVFRVQLSLLPCIPPPLCPASWWILPGFTAGPSSPQFIPKSWLRFVGPLPPNGYVVVS